jgi:excisionase family DNA binding protein
MSEQELLTVREVAEYLKLKERTIRDMIAREELRAIKIGKSYRIRREDLEILVQRRSGK